MSKQQMGMILLENGNKVLNETVSSQLRRDADSKVEVLDVKLYDFDDVKYHVEISPEKYGPGIMMLNMMCPTYKEIAQKSADAALKKAFGDMVVSPAGGYDVSIKIDLAKLPENPDDLIMKLSTIKQIVIGSAFDYFFDALLAGKTPEAPFKFSMRDDTTVYCFPGTDRVTFVYKIDFKDKTDKVLAGVFLQEFVESKKSLGGAPPVTFGENPVPEMKAFGIDQPQGNLVFVSFAVLKGHLEKGKKDKVVSVLQTFRNYLQYHLKCSKSLIHARMRARVVSFLQILNRAKFDTAPKEAKTFSGKTFVRQ